jgi:hypothetical protein
LEPAIEIIKTNKFLSKKLWDIFNLLASSQL